MSSTLTFGIDLLATPARTAASLIRWTENGAGTVHFVALDFEDTDLFEHMVSPEVTRTAIAAPFGWPADFISEIIRYTDTGEWTVLPGSPQYQELRRRVTDRVIELLGVPSLAFSSERVVLSTMRCASLLSNYWAFTGEPADRTGRGRVLETCPNAALAQWRVHSMQDEQDPGPYIGTTPGAPRRRARIVKRIAQYGENWLELTEEIIAACEASEHCLNALICALVARAAEIGRLEDVADPDAARREGWIRVPTAEPLSVLADPAGMVTSDQWIDPHEKLMPLGGYLEVSMPEQFVLEIQDNVGGPWMAWAALRADWFARDEDGSYLCTAHGGSPVYIRALSISPKGIIEHVDGGGAGTVYRYRLRPFLDEELQPFY